MLRTVIKIILVIFANSTASFNLEMYMAFDNNGGGGGIIQIEGVTIPLLAKLTNIAIFISSSAADPEQEQVLQLSPPTSCAAAPPSPFPHCSSYTWLVIKFKVNIRYFILATYRLGAWGVIHFFFEFLLSLPPF
jgi:hypothetical protein